MLQLYTYRKKRRWVTTTRFWVIVAILAIIVAYFVFRNVSMQDLCTSPYWKYVFEH